MTFWSYLAAHWKTTVNGVLALLITTGTVLLGTGSTILPTKTTIYLTIALALCRAYVGLIQQDAGTVQAILPGATTATAVPAHEVPDDPAATVVKESK